MRRLALLGLAALALAGCEGDGEPVATGPTPGSPGTTTTTSPEGPATASPSASPSPAATPRPIPPAWARPIEEDLAPEDLGDDLLVPEGARATARVELPAGGGAPDQVAVAYVIGEDPFAAEHGFAVWQRFPEPPAWSVVFAFVDAPDRGVLGIDVRGGDLTGDGHDDVLTFEQTGGTGACGRWRVVAVTGGDTDQLFARRTCDTEILIAGGALEMREAVYELGDAHCCPSAFRFTTLEWDGESFVESASRVEDVG